MLSIILILLLAVYFIVISRWLSRYRPEERTQKITKPLSVIINLSPLMGIVIFSVLFAFILKGRFAERATHAFIVFALWMYATRFYQYILAYYKKKEVFAASMIGMVFSILLAVLLTPLDRYVGLVYSCIYWYAVFIGFGLYIAFYAAAFMGAKKAK